MRILLLFLVLLFGTSSFAQNSVTVGEIFTLPTVQRPFCTYLGKELADQVFEEEYGSMFDSIAQFLKANEQIHFELRSHSDSRGKDSLNLALTQNRADDWLSHLVARGVDSSQVTAVGFGESMPRNVWIKDSTILLTSPNNDSFESVSLNEKYINSFRRTDPNKFQYFHQLNRREELIVVSANN